MITELDKSIISNLQGDLPLVERPYAEIAKKVGISEEELLDRLKHFKEEGIMRRMGTILYHHKVGYKANGMCAWRVPEEKAAEVGKVMATFPQASHVYQRPTYPDWPYNLFTMLHGTSQKECEETAQKISEETGIKEYKLLYSVKEFKKTSMNYF